MLLLQLVILLQREKEKMELTHTGSRYSLNVNHITEAWCKVGDLTKDDENSLDMFNLIAVTPNRYKKILKYDHKQPQYFMYLLDILSTKVMELFIELPIQHKDIDLFVKAKFFGRIDAMSSPADFIMFVSDITEFKRTHEKVESQKCYHRW